MLSQDGTEHQKSYSMRLSMESQLMYGLLGAYLQNYSVERLYSQVILNLEFNWLINSD